VPELPDITIYLEALESRVGHQRLDGIRIAKPFVLRSVDPPVSATEGRLVRGVERLGKRIVMVLEGDLFVILHLMIAGRLRWRPAGAAIPKGNGLAAFDFPTGSLVLTEAGKKRRASLHLVQGRGQLMTHDAGGIDVLEEDLAAFRARLTSEKPSPIRACSAGLATRIQTRSFTPHVSHPWPSPRGSRPRRWSVSTARCAPRCKSGSTASAARPVMGSQPR
jgi:formamidopyrimidine-DNA glycosylase